jgi:hypothetical protein
MLGKCFMLCAAVVAVKIFLLNNILRLIMWLYFPQCGVID